MERPMNSDRLKALEKEQAAFDRALPSLLESHPDEYVVFRDEAARSFHASFSEAYAQAIREFGPDEGFLVAHIANAMPQHVSVAWDLGVMFGGR
jgi:hypothetical protein